MTEEKVLNGKQVLAARLQMGMTRARFTSALHTFLGTGPEMMMSDYQLQNIERDHTRKPTEQETRVLIAFCTSMGIDVLALPTLLADRTKPLPVLHSGIPRRRPSLTSVQTPGHHLPLGSARPGPRRMFSNSELADANDCKRRWWLKWYRGITRPSEDVTGPLAIGKRVHRALEALYVPDGQEAQNPVDVLERLIIADWTALNDAGLYTEELKEKFDKEANLERAMISGYVEWVAETGEDALLRVTASETYLEATLLQGDDLAPGTGITEAVLIGKLDIRVTLASDGSRRIVDNKTTASFMELEERLRLGDPQMLTYMLLEWLNTDEGEARCNGALFNALRKVKRTPQAKPPFYKRITANYSDLQLTAFRTRVEGQITDLLSIETDLARGVDHRSVVYPRISRDCSWKCEFKAVCPMFDDGSAAEDLLAAMYVVRDPLSYYQTQGDLPE